MSLAEVAILDELSIKDSFVYTIGDDLSDDEPGGRETDQDKQDNSEQEQRKLQGAPHSGWPTSELPLGRMVEKQLIQRRGKMHTTL